MAEVLDKNYLTGMTNILYGDTVDPIRNSFRYLLEGTRVYLRLPKFNEYVCFGVNNIKDFKSEIEKSGIIKIETLEEGENNLVVKANRYYYFLSDNKDTYELKKGSAFCIIYRSCGLPPVEAFHIGVGEARMLEELNIANIAKEMIINHMLEDDSFYRSDMEEYGRKPVEKEILSGLDTELLMGTYAAMLRGYPDSESGGGSEFVKRLLLSDKNWWSVEERYREHIKHILKCIGY